MTTYNIKMNQNDGSFFNLYRPETSAKHCYVSKEISSLFGCYEETPIEYFLKQYSNNNLYYWEKIIKSWLGVQGNLVTGTLYTGTSSSSLQELNYSSTYDIDQTTGKPILSGNITTL